jgi:hypothetical protein
VKNLINVMYVVKNLVRIVTYRDTLEHILMINLTCDIHVCGKGFSRNLTYRHTLIRIHTGDRP